MCDLASSTFPLSWNCRCGERPIFEVGVAQAVIDVQVSRIDAWKSRKMLGVVCRDRNEVFRIGRQNRLGCEDGIAIKGCRVGCRQTRVSY